MHTYARSKTGTKTCIAGLFEIAPNWKQPGRSSTVEGMNCARVRRWMSCNENKRTTPNTTRNLTAVTRSERHERVCIYMKFKNGQNRSMALEVRTVGTLGGAVTGRGTVGFWGNWPYSSSSSGYWVHESVHFVKIHQIYDLCTFLYIWRLSLLPENSESSIYSVTEIH